MLDQMLTRYFELELEVDYQRFHRLLSLPDASINCLNVVTVLPKLMTWLDSHPSYKLWLTRSSVLSIVGASSSGNTHLCSHVVQKLVGEYPTREALFLSYSFYRWDNRRKSERSFVVSMIRQLLTLKPEFHERVKYVTKLMSCENSITCARLWTVFRYLLTIPKNSRVFIILNAADQCQDHIASKVGLLTTISPPKVPLNIVMTSSVHLEFPEVLTHHRILLEDANWRGVVRSIAEERVLQIVGERPVWKESQQAIVDKLCSGEYTYLYVMLNLDVLAHSKIPSTKDALNQQLMTPTFSIEKVFDTMVSDLKDVELAREALNWIYHAVRPLTISELAVALTLKPDPLDDKVASHLTFDILVEKVSWDLMRDLGSLLETTVKIVNDRIYFAHHTFHDYLENHSDLLIPHFHASIVEWSIHYLSLCSKYTAKVSLALDHLEQPHISIATAFLDYADLYWGEHYRLAHITTNLRNDQAGEHTLTGNDLKLVGNKPPHLDEIVAQFLRSDTAALKRWTEKCTQAFGWQDYIPEDPLFIACKLGLDNIVQLIVKDETKDSQEQIERRLGTAARILAGAGNTDILQALFEDAEVDVLRLLVRAAAEYGHANTIKFLLTKMHDSGVESPLAADQGSDSPLLVAALNGHTEAFEILLLEGYDMKAVDYTYNSLVHLASQLGDAETLLVMESLQGATFKSLMATTNISDMSPLQLVCETGSSEAFEIVLRNSPDEQVHAAKEDSLPPLAIAARAGHVSIAERLLEIGADMNSGRIPVKPLRLAARNGHFDVVCTLVAKMAKVAVDKKDSESLEAERASNEELLQSALGDAIYSGKVEVTEFLLSKTERDIDRDRQFIRDAVEEGYLDILEVLVKAEIALQQEKYNPILDVAIRKNFVDIVSYLTIKGVKPQWDGEETSLHFATRLGYKLCVRELLRVCTNEDLQRKDKNGNTALDVAASKGEFETFKELLAWEKAHASADQPWRPQPKTLVLAIGSKISSGRKWTKFELITFLLRNGWTAEVADRSPDIPLHAAIKSGDADVVDLLLREKPRIDSINHEKKTALHVAVQKDLVEAIDTLLDNGANPNLVDRDSLSPLHIASQKSPKLVRTLLGMDKDPNDIKSRIKTNIEQETLDGRRALHFATYSATMTSTLLELDRRPQLDPREGTSKATPLILAAKEGSVEAIPLLLAAGADADAKDAQERTALNHAISRDGENIAAVQYLMSKANPNARMSDQSTPLYAAVRNSKDDIALYLLDKANSDPNLYGGTFHSPLQAAAFNGNLKIATHLLEKDANANAVGGKFGSPLHAAIRGGNLELIKLLLGEKYKPVANLNVYPFGTPLHVLAASSLTDSNDSKHTREIATLLLEHDADMINSKYKGWTPLMIAMPEEEFSLFLELKADPNVTDDTRATALHYAAGLHPITAVQQLLEKDANVEARDSCNRSVLYFAALSSDEEKFQEVLKRVPLAQRKASLAEIVPAALKVQARPIFEMILEEEDIDFNVPDRCGWTSLDVAECYGMDEVVKTLKSRGAMNGSEKGVPTEWCFEDKDGFVDLSANKMEAGIEGHTEGITIPLAESRFSSLNGQAAKNSLIY